MFNLFSACEEDNSDSQIADHLKGASIELNITDVNENGATFHIKFLGDWSDQITYYGIDVESGEGKFTIVPNETFGQNDLHYRLGSDLVANTQYNVTVFAFTVKRHIFSNKATFRSMGSGNPIIFDFTPKNGPENTRIFLKGKNFSPIPHHNKILFNGAEANIEYAQSDSIVFRVPYNYNNGPAPIEIYIGQKHAVASDSFFVHGILVHSISQNKGYQGQEVAIRGDFRGATINTIQVFFGLFGGEVLEFNHNEILTRIPTIFFNDFNEDHEVNIVVSNGYNTDSLPEPFLIQSQWEKKSPFPYSYSWDYLGFTFENRGYILEMNNKLLYRYDPQVDKWTGVSSFPGNRHDGGQFVVSGRRVFKFGGFSQSAGKLREWWVYDFDTFIWTQLPDLPFEYLRVITFSHNNNIYVINENSEVWRKNENDTSFTRLSDFPEEIIAQFLYSFVLDGEVYAVMHGKTWKYIVSTDTWVLIKTNGLNTYANPTNPTIGFSSSTHGWVLISDGSIFRFNKANYDWEFRTKIPGCYNNRSKKIIFIIDDLPHIAITQSSIHRCEETVLKLNDF
ncbi:MAG: IPT/TIG domain-containing protein [Cyclobacteriaceae bacterium]